jgi:hypothetical protein
LGDLEKNVFQINIVRRQKKVIKEFSNEVASQLNYYVYRLIDPRNGQTFYVGKGKGNRLFHHVQCAIDYYDGYDAKCL